MHPGEVGSGEVVHGRAREVLEGSIWPQHAVDVSAAVAGFGLRIPVGLGPEGLEEVALRVHREHLLIRDGNGLLDCILTSGSHLMCFVYCVWVCVYLF